MAVALALSVAACSTQSDRPIVRTQLVVPELTAAQRSECLRPVVIPKRALTEKDVVSLWGRDRRELVVCGARHKSTVATIGLSVPRP